MAETMIAPARESVTSAVSGGLVDVVSPIEVPTNGVMPKSTDDIQFVTDRAGEIVGVLLRGQAFEDYEEYLVDKGMAQAARESKGEETIPWEQVKAELIAEGKLDA